MKMTYLYVGLVVLLVAGIVFVRNNSSAEREVVSTVYDGFAQCLADAGAIFYGAYWCPHCQEQKRMFANSKALPYVECSTPSGDGQTQICIDEGVTSYPTWKFADGTVLEGTRQFDELASQTGCEVPAL